MAFRLGKYQLIFLFLALTALNVSVVEGGCYSTWSRCSGWSSWGTGRLWKSCNDRCIELGDSGGSCMYCPSSCWMSSRAYKCVCNRVGSC